MDHAKAVIMIYYRVALLHCPLSSITNNKAHRLYLSGPKVPIFSFITLGPLGWLLWTLCYVMLYNFLVKPIHSEWHPSQLPWLWLWLISQCLFWQLHSCTLKWQKCLDLHPLYETAYFSELKMLFRLLMQWDLNYLWFCAFVLNQCLKALSKQLDNLALTVLSDQRWVTFLH